MSNPMKKEPHNGMMKAHCPRCDYFLATIHDKEVSIRIREHFCYFRGGLVRIICGGCSAENFIVDKEYEKENADLLNQLDGKLNVLRARIEAWVSRKNFNRKP